MNVNIRFIFSFIIASLFLLSCKEEMEIDPFLKEHSNSYSVKTEGSGWQGTVEIGHFTSYDNEFGIGWMQAAGIANFFNEDKLVTFSTDNNDNYTYDHIISEIGDRVMLDSFANKFNLPLSIPATFQKAIVGYLYAPHDEYSMACIQEDENSVSGFLSNGFDTYEIQAVLSKNEPDKLIGYQIKLYEEYVGALQISEKQVFNITSEYCDATEIVLAAIASTLIKCKQL